MTGVTQILNAIEQGDPSAAEQLLPLIYEELRKLASAKMAQEKPGQTLQATGLVHEAYMRLVDNDKALHWNSRGHFFGAAAEAMRRILVDAARRRQSRKRGGEFTKKQIAFDQLPGTDDEHLVEVDAALDELAAADPRAAEIIKLRFFAGLSVPQTAQVMGISPRTVDRLWAYARAWLHQRIREE